MENLSIQNKTVRIISGQLSLRSFLTAKESGTSARYSMTFSSSFTCLINIQYIDERACTTYSTAVY
jgi:hypothetical protein